MKLLLTLALVALASARPDGDHYDSKYDNFDADALIANERLLKAYTHCIIGDGKCTPEGADIRTQLPEAYASSCSKCTEKQKVIIAKIVKAVKSKLTEEYAAIRKKVDPENKYDEEEKKFLAKYAT